MTVAVVTVEGFILADNGLLWEALTRILKKKSGIRVVGASAFLPEIAQQIAQLAPAVLLSDSASVALSELRLIAEIRTAVPGL